MGLADVVRLFAIPIFALIAYRDVKFRRVPDRVWYPLVGLGVVTLGYDLLQLQDAAAATQQVFFLRVGIAVGFLLVLAAAFYALGLIDATIARALAVIGVLYPLVPSYPVFGMTVPLVPPGHDLLSFSILSNAALIGLLYPLGYLGWNGMNGRFAPVMFAGRPVDRESVPDRHGRILETSEGYNLLGPDVEAIKAYLRWREITVSLIAQRPEALRIPDYQVDEAAEGAAEAFEFPAESRDEWGAERFLDAGDYAGDLEPEQLRQVLDLIADQEEVWVSANFPFIVPVFVGLVVALTVGDLATGILLFIG